MRKCVEFYITFRFSFIIIAIAIMIIYHHLMLLVNLPKIVFILHYYDVSNVGDLLFYC